MTPRLIESYAADITDEVNCSSSVDCDGRRLVITDGDLMRESTVSCATQAENKAFPRFNLRKRTMPDDDRGAVISSYNSDFLTGLFEDIARGSSPTVEEQDPRGEESLSSKKSRLSLTRSMSHYGRSYANLAAVSPSPCSRAVINVQALLNTTNATENASKQDLHHCVSSSSSEQSSSFSKLAFPHLPSTVSGDSKTNITRKGQQTPDSDKNPYGWFVEIDDDYSEHDVDAYSSSVNKSLAFVAPTAPKADNHDAEVEWAKAADTIDDVLGDFF
jgi:hypothetical protein